MHPSVAQSARMTRTDARKRTPLSFFLLLHHSRLPDEAELTVSAILDAGEDLATALTPRWFQSTQRTSRNPTVLPFLLPVT